MPAVARASCPRTCGRGRPHDSRRDGGATISDLMYTVPKLIDFSPAALDSGVGELPSSLHQESAGLGSENDWKAFRDRWKARKNGILTQLNDLWLKAAPGPNKRDVGQRVNELKAKVEQAVDATLARIQSGVSSGKLAAERLDITLPGI